jgi:ribonuclease P protein component
VTRRDDQCLKAEFIIRDGKTFDLIRECGERIEGRFFRTCYFVEGKGEVRAGFVVPKRVGRPVERNRVKKLLRESYRKTRSRLKDGTLLLFIARPGSSQAKYWEIEHEMVNVLKRAGLVK